MAGERLHSEEWRLNTRLQKGQWFTEDTSHVNILFGFGTSKSLSVIESPKPTNGGKARNLEMIHMAMKSSPETD